ncbi:MAG TPA: NAD(P)H-dependent oxidoreductase subunit E [Thermomicrobiales bacterium]|nr:NAD(P)H-dependent oxidoreductase subunit E [Thermomicrobiales bacterium]
MLQEARVSESDLDRVRELLRTRYHPRDHEEAQELILGALQDVQQIIGWVPHEAAVIVGDHLGVTENRIYGLLTFYADFRIAPPGKHFMLLCHGSACYVGGSQRLIDEMQQRYGVHGDETTSDGELTLQIVNGCLGVCDLAPVIHLDHIYYGHLTSDSMNETISEAIRRGPTPGAHEAH